MTRQVPYSYTELQNVTTNEKRQVTEYQQVTRQVPYTYTELQNVTTNEKRQVTEYQRVTRRALAKAEALGYERLVYTVNDAARMRELNELGASGIFTDRPREALAALSGPS